MIHLEREKHLESPLIRTASGLLSMHESLYLICDDFSGLFTRTLQDGWSTFASPSAISGILTYEERKKLKPDLECIFQSLHPENEIILMPSGSRPNRREALRFQIDSQKFRKDNFENLFSRLSEQIENINIEGAVRWHNQLILLNRGVQNSESRIVVVSSDFKVEASYAISFGDLNSVPAHGTELCLFDDRLFALFSAENTVDSYNDGEVVGSGIAEISLQDFSLRSRSIFDRPIKAEGLARWNGKWLLCTDPDGSGGSEFYSFTTGLLD